MDMDKAMTNPAAVFQDPEQVISAPDLSRERLLRILSESFDGAQGLP
jgi:hypothetical protein